MRTSGHTPGPWVREANSKAQWIHGDGQPMRFVAMATGDSQEEIAANARLIAAAPDLLEALSMARAFMGNPTHAADIPVFEQIDKAIAKAEGR